MTQPTPLPVSARSCHGEAEGEAGSRSCPRSRALTPAPCQFVSIRTAEGAENAENGQATFSARISAASAISAVR